MESTLTLHCRHCWKLTKVWVGPNEQHIEARCPVCGGWIKFLGKAEIKTLLLKFLQPHLSAKPRIAKYRGNGGTHESAAVLRRIIRRKTG